MAAQKSQFPEKSILLRTQQRAAGDPSAICVVVPEWGLRTAVMRGIARYARQRNAWLLVDVAGEDLRGISRRKPAGVIAMLTRQPMCRQARDSGLPIVSLAWVPPEEGIACVCSDNRRIGQLAAQYFLNLGVQTLGYVHYSRAFEDRLRFEGFRDETIRTGAQVHQMTTHYAWWATDRQRQVQASARWLTKLAKPVGVLCFNDSAAQVLATAARSVGLAIPADVAVMGVDDDEIACEYSPVPLSSVAIDGIRLGYMAAEMLDHLIQGQPRPRAPLLLEPQGVIERASTDMLAVDDPVVCRALRFIRAKSDDCLPVSDIVAHCDVSRRRLEVAFRQKLGRTIAQEILRMRLERALRLLAGGDLPVRDVAERCGFATAAHFAALVRTQTNMTPTQYREAHRLGTPKSGRTRGDELDGK